MNPVFENLTVENIERNFGADMLRQANYLYDSQAVIDLGFESDTQVLWGVVLDRGKDYQCQVKFEEDRIMIGCGCGKVKEGQPCAHVVTLLLMWVKDREKILAAEDDEEFFNAFAESETEAAVSTPVLAEITPEKVQADYRQKLEYLTVGQMRELAGRRGIKVTGQRREGILTALVAGLVQTANQEAAIEKLSAAARQAFDLLLVMNDDLERVYIKTALRWIETALAGIDPHPGVENALEELVQMGLAFTLDGRIKLPLALLWVRDQNPRLVKPYTGNMDHIETSSPSAFSRLALWLLLLSQAGALEYSPLPKAADMGGWPVEGKEVESWPLRDSRERTVPPVVSFLKPEALRRLAPTINYPSEKIDYAARLLGDSGLWEKGNPRKLTPAFTHWLQMDVYQQGRSLFETALSLEAPVELDRAQAVGGFKTVRDTYMRLGYRAFLQDMVRVRRLFFKLLRLLPGDAWLETESILHLLHGLAPDFNFENNNQRLLWLEIKGTPVKTGNFAEWRQTYGIYYQSILTGPAFWMGMCDIAWQDGKPAGFRITRCGKYLLGDQVSFDREVRPAEACSIFFQKDGVIELSPINAEAEVIGLVMLIGRIEPVHPPAGGRNSPPVLEKLAYRIQNEGLGRAFENGWTWERMQQVLENAAGNPLPPDLAARLRTVWDHYGRLHIYQDMALIQFGDDYCLPELLTGTRLGQSLLYQFSPRLIAVRPENVPDILNDLRSKGYTPRLGEMPRD